VLKTLYTIECLSIQTLDAINTHKLMKAAGGVSVKEMAHSSEK
jgi:hypothetical protein